MLELKLRIREKRIRRRRLDDCVERVVGDDDEGVSVVFVEEEGNRIENRDEMKIGGRDQVTFHLVLRKM